MSPVPRGRYDPSSAAAAAAAALLHVITALVGSGTQRERKQNKLNYDVLYLFFFHQRHQDNAAHRFHVDVPL